MNSATMPVECTGGGDPEDSGSPRTALTKQRIVVLGIEVDDTPGRPKKKDYKRFNNGYMQFKDLNITAIAEKNLEEVLQYNIDQKTKPLGSLGTLEAIALQIGLIQQTTDVVLTQPTMLTVAADHEIISEGFASAPADVTWQQVLNFLNGGGAIGAFCTQVGMALKVADAGVNHDFEDHPNLYKVKVRKGTRNFLNEPAMSAEEGLKAIENGREIVRDIAKSGCNIIGFGEMGIGNTSPASALLAAFTGMPVEECVGFGAGINDEMMELKKDTLKAAIQKHGVSDDAFENLCRFGGLEIATIAGGMLEAAAKRMVILVDGYITTSAFMVAYELNKTVKDYAIFSHASKEPGHRFMVEYIGAEPLLDMNLRLGEGTGAALALPIVQTAVAMLTKMTSFTEAKVFNVSDSRLK